MENNRDFEDYLKDQLRLTAGSMEPSDELYSRIMTDANKKRGSFILLKNKLLNISKKRIAAAALAFTIIAGTISFGTSGSLRTFAAETINRIKTIFIVDGTSNNYKVVEAPSDKPLFTIRDGKITALSDSELTAKVGYKVSYPKIIAKDFKLVSKHEFVMLQKVSYDKGSELAAKAREAVDNDIVFKSLSEYDPVRTVDGYYLNGSYSFGISTNPINSTLQKELDTLKPIKIDINGLQGYWFQSPVPQYPKTQENGEKVYDMTQKPSEIKNVHGLIWLSDKVFYIMAFDKNELSMDQAADAARDFMLQISK